MYGITRGPAVVGASPDNSYEQGIIDKHSTPGLRRGELTRAAKKDHLNGQYKKTYRPDEIEAMLDKIYA